MDTALITTTGFLKDLTTDDCWSLVAGQPVGRIAWNGSDGLTVLPVNFTVDGSSVHLRTAAYSTLARECDDSVVAFQVDKFDESTRSGWSVLLRGHAHVDLRSPGREAAPNVWPAGSRSLDVRVVVEQVTGRRVGP